MTILYAAAPSPADFFGPTLVSGCSLDTVDAGANHHAADDCARVSTSIACGGGRCCRGECARQAVR